SLFDNKAENSDIKISNFKFIEKKNQVILVSGEKIGNDMLQSTPIRFSSYTITKQDKQYKWAFSAYCVTNSTYLNVDDAFVDPCINKLIRD
ncbi:TPA: carbapenem self-resistance protein CarG family protein, partial [Proteus mirabilis]